MQIRPNDPMKAPVATCNVQIQSASHYFKKYNKQIQMHMVGFGCTILAQPAGKGFSYHIPTTSTSDKRFKICRKNTLLKSPWQKRGSVSSVRKAAQPIKSEDFDTGQNDQEFLHCTICQTRTWRDGQQCWAKSKYFPIATRA